MTGFHMKVGIKSSIWNELIDQQWHFCLEATSKKLHYVSVVDLRQDSNFIYELINLLLDYYS